MCLLAFLSSLVLFVSIRAVIVPIRHYQGPKLLEQDVTFHLYHRNDILRGQKIFIDNIVSLNTSKYDSDLPTKFIIHGWTHGKDVPWVVEMREALLRAGSWNVIVVDWFDMAHAFYAESRNLTRLVGEQLGKFCVFLKGIKKIPMSSIHFIGHSLGAQVSGYAGNYIKRNLGDPVGRITGLDPAAPLFEWPYRLNLKERLDSTDASFVDIIHTNGRNLGIIDPAGHVDYYPNGGQKQPGCKLWLCSHMRSCEFFIASIKNPKIFKAYHYKSWKDYLSRHFHELHKESFPMGLAASPQIPKGTYFLETMLGFQIRKRKEKS